MQNSFNPIFTMKRFVPVFVFILASASSACAAYPHGTLTTLHAIRSLTSAEASKGLPVAFEATVTYCDNNGSDLFVQEGDEAIYVEIKSKAGLVPGDRVLVRGKTRSSFGTDILGERTTLLHHGAPPKPVTAGFAQLVSAERDCLRVTVRATIRSADTVSYGNAIHTYMKLLVDGGTIDATALGSDPSKLKGLLDADVEVTGAVSGMYDSKMQLTGILLEVPTMADVKILGRAMTRPDSLPITPMNKVLSAYYVHDLTRRVRVQGTITYYQPGSAIVLQDGSNSLWISTHASNPMKIGDVAEATGFPDARYNFLALTDGEIQDTHIFKPQPAQASTWRQLATWNSGNPDGHQSDLVSIEGEVVTVIREASQDEFVLVSDGKLLTAIYRHPPAKGPSPPIKEIPQGSRIRVTGICMAVQTNAIDPAEVEVPFNILLRSFDDITVVASPSLLTVRNLIIMLSLMLWVVIAVGAWGWALNRKVRRQTGTLAALAFLEQRRSRILEGINSSKPLAEILEEITEMISVMLNSAPCWCEVTDGARLGNYPPNVDRLCVLQEEIPARSGPPLGTLFAGLHSTILPGTQQTFVHEKEVLSVGAKLAMLAMDTRRLYSDLLRRSEFDPLTNIHNRFSLGKRLDTQIEEARENARIFGFIYIDLDKFKPINDRYGHHIGDLYLQEVARRMKQQLRSHDLLARLGGDEFAVLLPIVRNRTDIEEIVRRLEHCFNDPFAVGGKVLLGTASFGYSIYPADGATGVGLLSAADAAMYVAKHSRKQAEIIAAGGDNPATATQNRAQKDPA